MMDAAYLLRRQRHADDWSEQRRTPLLFGRASLQSTLPLDAAYPPLDPDVGQLVHEQLTHKQHRLELLAPPGRLLESLWYVDRRFAFAAHLRHLPGEAIAWDATPRVEGYRPAAYRLEVSVPRGWTRLGLVPRTLGHRESTYPREPGSSFETWLFSPELRLLETCGWSYAVRERVLFADEHDPGGDPLRGWSDWIARRYMLLEDDDERRGRLQQAVRVTIGAFASQSRPEVSGPYTSADAIPGLRPGERGLVRRRRPDGYWERYVLRELKPYERCFYQPHWAAYIWSAARAAMARQALTLVRDGVVGILADALFVERAPALPDDGHIGRFRTKGFRPGPLSVPGDVRALAGLFHG